ncbi:hypothetical protein N7478_002351 [Penicillium angulare]|uniref:uncharacterized protein n=1 Tax=Penicillium angulare TaxID=116970 RepID=UPI0025413286|nr:uncharacterized protein N7478_002351 [Penicillium angulare]KAJ5286665.1 hypothetical protein N7478_002351 [Penicillium angulare]
MLVREPCSGIIQSAGAYHLEVYIATAVSGKADDSHVVLDWRPEWARTTYETNLKNISSKPYAPFIFDEWMIHKSSLPAFIQPIPEAHLLPLSNINRLLEPGYLPVETGFHSGYAA